MCFRVIPSGTAAVQAFVIDNDEPWPPNTISDSRFLWSSRVYRCTVLSDKSLNKREMSPSLDLGSPGKVASVSSHAATISRGDYSESIRYFPTGQLVLGISILVTTLSP